MCEYLRINNVTKPEKMAIKNMFVTYKIHKTIEAEKNYHLVKQLMSILSVIYRDENQKGPTGLDDLLDEYRKEII